jgi:hypothetical protein
MGVDRRAINVVLAALGLERGELARRMGYDEGYVSNVLNGLAAASAAFRTALGETIATLLLGPHDSSAKERYPAEPLVALIERRAGGAASQRDFYRELGTSPRALRSRRSFDGVFVDRICCALGVHPANLYPDHYGQEEA